MTLQSGIPADHPAVDDERFSVAGQVAVVTGANSGLGRSIALGLIGAGAFVVGTGRDEAKNASVGQEFGDRGEILPADVRDEDAMASVIAAAASRHGAVDILVNNAGIGGRSPFLEMSLEEWRLMLDTHLTGAFLATKLAAQAMIAGGRGGSVINIGSMYSLFGPPAGVHYATAKTGLLGLTRALAVELAPHDIRVNAILPGWIETEMTRLVRETALVAGVLPKIPLARFGVPDDLVGTAILLASPAGRYITGAEIAISGGYHVSDRPRGS
jgi:2-dehydro-3-deoxy-D-gluconate 5-dehydrogenase